MSVVLTVSMCPTAALANDATDGAQADGTPQAVSSQPKQAPAPEEGTSAGADEAPVGERGAVQAVAQKEAGANVNAKTGAKVAADGQANVKVNAKADAKTSANEVASSATSSDTPLSVMSVAEVAAEPSEAAIDIYSAALTVNGSTNYNVAVGDTLGVLAKDGANKAEISADKLTYKWESHAYKTGDFTPIEGATNSTYVVPPELEGKFIRCTINAGGADKTTRVSNKIAKAGSFVVKEVTVLAGGKEIGSDDKIEAGTVLTAKATDSSNADATSRVTWKWYASSEKYGTRVSDSDVIEGSTSSTFTVPSGATYLGKYIFAGADGGFDETKSSAAGQIGVAGAVDLYKIEIKDPPAAVHVGDTLAATAYKKGSSSYSNPPVAAGDVVNYQWQYSKSKYSSSFTDIPGATSATYTVPATLPDNTSLLGCYLRVKATSNNEVVSTSKPSSYGSGSVDPVGPVAQAGQYTLAEVSLESSAQAMQVGATITPATKIKDGDYSTKAAPADAKLTYTWYKSTSPSAPASEWTKITDGYESSTGILTLTPSLKGSYLKLEASALDNTVSATPPRVVGANEYDLLRITVNPASGDLFTQGKLNATIQAKKITNSTTNGDNVTTKVSIQWYTADTATAAESTWVPISGATSTSPELTIPDAAAGKYLAAKATSGDSSVTFSDKRIVVNSNSLEAAKRKLSDSFKFTPQHGVDTNANDYVKKALAKLGYTDIDVTTVSASLPSAKGRAAATGGVSVAAGSNGAITYFFEDPSTKTDYTSYSVIRNLEIEFQLSRAGEAAVTFAPSNARLAWDLDKVKEWINTNQSKIAIQYAAGDSAASVTSDIKLPYRLKANDSSYSAPSLPVSWESSDESAVKVDGYGWSDYTGKVVRGGVDRTVTLTATLEAGRIDSSDSVLEKLIHTVSFEVTVKGDPEKIAREKQELTTKLEAGFVKDKLTYSVSREKIGESALADDVQLPRPRDMSLDGKYFDVTYTASNDNVAINGYRANVFLVWPGDTSNSVDITCTITKKESAEVTASKTLSFTIAAVSQAEIDQEVQLMDAAVADYWNAISAGQSASNVTKDLHSFKKATFNEQNTLVWSYDVDSSEAAGSGIIAADLPGYDSMGSQGWRTFRSSRGDIIQHENLLFATQPTYNTTVTVDSLLQSEKFARYAKRYPNDETLKKLAGTAVSATFTVTGTTGQNPPTDPNAGFKVTCAFYGPNATGTIVPWATRTTFTVKEGATALDITNQLIAQAGLKVDLQGNYLSSITSPFTGEVLGWKQATQTFWQLFVNGKSSDKYANELFLKPSDRIVWSYSKFGDAEPGVDDPATDPTDDPSDQPKIHKGNIPSDYPSAWAGFVSGKKNGAVVTQVKTPTQAAKEGWTFDPFKDSKATGYMQKAVSDPLIVGKTGDVYILTHTSIFKIDAASGKVKTQKRTGFRSGFNFSRPAYYAGLIIAAADDGQVAAFAADTLDLVWRYDLIGGQGYQNLSSITAVNGKVYVTFTMVGGMSVSAISAMAGDEKATVTPQADPMFMGTSSKMVCLDANSGKEKWVVEEVAKDGGSAGYYWAGACPSGTDLMIADEAGQVKLIDSNTGMVKQALSLGTASRSSVVALEDVDSAGNGTYLVVTRDDATLHKIVRRGNNLTEQGAVSFAATSTSTPAVAHGKVFVCGCDAQNYGTLSVIDLATMKVEKTVRGSKGAAQSSPLVSVQGSDIYAYFTCNNRPGGVYSYKLGDAQANLIFTPKASDQQYCTASVIADGKGNLYYTNDSGKLFKLVGGGAIDNPSKNPEGGESEEPRDESGSGSGTANKESTGNLGASFMAMQNNLGLAQADTPRARVVSNAQKSTQPQVLSAETSASSDINAPTREFPLWAIVGIGVAIIALVVAGAGLYRRRARR